MLIRVGALLRTLLSPCLAAAAWETLRDISGKAREGCAWLDATSVLRNSPVGTPGIRSCVQVLRVEANCSWCGCAARTLVPGCRGCSSSKRGTHTCAHVCTCMLELARARTQMHLLARAWTHRCKFAIRGHTCTCLHVHGYTFVLACAWTCTHIFAHAYVPVQAQVCMSRQVQARACVSMHIQYMYVCRCMCMDTNA